MRRTLLAVLLLATAPSLVFGQLDDKCTMLTCTECNCYWSSECGSGQSCDYGSGCTKTGKLDGTCKASGAGGLSPVGVDMASSAIGLWMDGYERPDRIKGLPNADIWKRIEALNLSQEDKRKVQLAAFNALDVLMGFDFAHPRGNCAVYDARCLGILRIPPDRQAQQLLQHAKRGLTAALRDRNTSVLRRELRTFWRQQPRFTPHHTGRCYPHGHPEFGRRSPQDCQFDELSRIVDDLLATYKPQKSARMVFRR